MVRRTAILVTLATCAQPFGGLGAVAGTYLDFGPITFEDQDLWTEAGAVDPGSRGVKIDEVLRLDERFFLNVDVGGFPAPALWGSMSGRFDAQLAYGFSTDIGAISASAGYAPRLRMPDGPLALGQTVDLMPEAGAQGATLRQDAMEMSAYAGAGIGAWFNVDLTAAALAQVPLKFAGGARMPYARIVEVADETLTFRLPGVPEAEVDIDFSQAKLDLYLDLASLVGASSPVEIKFEEKNGAIFNPTNVSLAVKAAEMDMQLPFHGEASITAAGDAPISVSTREDFFDYSLDLDTWITPLGGFLIEAAGAGMEFDLWDLTGGWNVGIDRAIEMTRDLMVTLRADNLVSFGGLDATEWTGRWSDLPEISLYESTLFTPEFFLDASMRYRLALQPGIHLELEFVDFGAWFFGASYDPGPLWERRWLFAPDDLEVTMVDERMPVGSQFSRIEVASFLLEVDSPIDVVAAPIPGTLPLLATAVMGPLWLRRRRRVEVAAAG
jgi:hypothetical protein